MRSLKRSTLPRRGLDTHPIFDQPKRTGYEPEARQEAVQSRIDGSPILTLRQWFREQAANPKKFHPNVARYIERLFERVADQIQGRWNGVPSLPLHQATKENELLFIEIMIAKVEHAMLNTGALDREFFTLSKAASLWLSLRHRLNTRQPVAGRNGDEKAARRVPPRADSERPEDDDQEADADSASDDSVR